MYHVKLYISYIVGQILKESQAKYGHCDQTAAAGGQKQPIRDQYC